MPSTEIAVYAGIAKTKDSMFKDAPWQLCAAFKAVTGEADGNALLFASPAQGLEGEMLSHPSSLTVFFNLSEQEAAQARAALAQAQKDLTEGRASMDDILDWSDLTPKNRLDALYQPKMT